MTLTAHTKQYFILSLLSVVAVFAATGYVLVQVRQQGQALESSLVIITEKNAQAATFTKIERQITESTKERTKIADAFFSSGAEGPDFLSLLESWSTEFGLRMNVLDLREVSSTAVTKKKEVMVKFAFAGETAAVMAFSTLLESLPYHARLESLVIREGVESGQTRAEVDLRVTIFPAT
jgi:adenine-specific DNA methylase